MGFDVGGKVCLLTGSAQGMGKEFAGRLLSRGARVCVSDVNEAMGLETCREFRGTYGASSVAFFRLDVTEREDWENAFKHCLEEFGDAVQVLVNNAGVGIRDGLLPPLKVNLIGTVIGCETFIRHAGVSKGGKGGRIVNVASMAGMVNGHLTGPFSTYGYTISKWGVVCCTREVAFGGSARFFETSFNPWKIDGVKAYAICPSFVDTQMLGENAENIFAKVTVLKVGEVGKVLLQALDGDINGSVHCVMPGLPTIQMVEMNKSFLMPFVFPLVKIASAIGLTGTECNIERFFHFFLFMVWLFGFCSALILAKNFF